MNDLRERVVFFVSGEGLTTKGTEWHEGIATVGTQRL